jgi:putative colanic acid biosynthesis acetyltransferase WcaF
LVNLDLSLSPYSTREKAARMLWGLVQATLFRLSFHSWYGWRRAVLVAFGARLDPVVRIRRSVRIECPWNLAVGHDSAIGDRVVLYCLGPVSIGSRVTVSQGAHLCAGTHDFTRRAMPLVRPRISVGDDAWICADAFVGPSVDVGAGAILGARAVAMRSLDPWTIYAGNPARAVRARPPFVD